MAEDWRVTATLPDDGSTERVLRTLNEHEVEDEVREKLGARIAVSGEDTHIFLYADTREVAERAERALGEVLSQHGLSADWTLDRWHPLEERWEDGSLALPQTAEEQEIEHQRLEEQETEDSQRTGLAQWEVRVELPSHRDAVQLADRLESEGDPVVRRWKYLVVGANDEDDADELARTIAGEAPSGTKVHVEPGGGVVWQALPPNPFAVFGGLAG
jgi:hypothetical protein